MTDAVWRGPRGRHGGRRRPADRREAAAAGAWTGGDGVRVRPLPAPAALAGLVGVMLLVPLLVPTLGWLAAGELPDARYRRGEEASVYRFLAARPRDAVVASLTELADFIPPFARRSVVIGPKYAVPYHSGYHQEMERRARDLIRAQYSPDLQELQAVTRQYGVDYWLVRRVSFDDTYVDYTWINDFQPEARNASEQLRQGAQPALERLMDRCAAYTVSNLVLVEAECVLAAVTVSIDRR